jgi:hypothetical protein
MYGYTTANNATIRSFEFKTDVKLLGLNMTGGGSASEHICTDFHNCKDITIRDCIITDFEGRGFRFDTCIYCNVDGITVAGTNLTGFGYGVNIGHSCGWINVVNSHFTHCRHGVVVGGSEGTARWITIKNNKIASSSSNGINAHDSCDYVTIDGNTIVGHEDSATADGIFVAGANSTITNNIITWATRDGIQVRCQFDDALGYSSYTISGNSIRTPQRYGMYIYNDTDSAIIKNLKVDNNNIDSPVDHGIYIHAKNEDIQNFTINGNVINSTTGAGNNSLILDADTGYDIRDGNICNNVFFRGDDLAQNVYFVSADAAGIFNVIVSGNQIYNGTYCIQAVNDNYLLIHGNILRGDATGDIDTDGANNVETDNIS